MAGASILPRRVEAVTGGETCDPRRWVVRWLGAVAASALMSGAACGDDDEPATTTSTTGTSTTSTTTQRQPALTRSCTHQEREVRIVVRYPEGWHTNSDAGVVPCSAFDPEPFQLRPGTEFPPELAVVLRVEPIDYGRASAGQAEDERRMMIDGRGAVRQEVVATGTGLEPAGQRSVRYVVDGGAGRSVIATTSDVEGNDFPLSTGVLDAMVTALDIEPRNGP